MRIDYQLWKRVAVPGLLLCLVLLCLVLIPGIGGKAGGCVALDQAARLQPAAFGDGQDWP